MNSRLYAYRHWLAALWILAFAAFHMAWTAHPAAAFTLNGFDLAEQIQIHPAIRAESPPLRSSGLLWFAIPLTAIGLTMTALLFQNMWIRLTLHGTAFLMALRIIPPENMLREPRLLLEDNYGRLLTLLTIVGIGGVMLSMLFRKYLVSRLHAILPILSVLGIIFPMIGFYRGFNLLQELQLDVTIGGGAVIYVVILLIIGGGVAMAVSDLSVRPLYRSSALDVS